MNTSNQINLSTISALALVEIFEGPANELLLKHDDCNLVWLPCDGTLYADDRDTLDETIAPINSIFRDGNFAEVIKAYYQDVSEVLEMFKTIIELNTELAQIHVADSFDNHSISLADLITELEDM